MKKLQCLLALLTALLASTGAIAQSTSWNTGGNTNLNPNAFIGTTDQVPVAIKSGGATQMKISPSGTVSVSSLTGTGRAYVTVGPSGELLRDPGPDSTYDCSTKLFKADGNFLTSACFLGSTNSAPLRLVTDNAERMRISADGKVGIGTLTPKGQLQIGSFIPFAISYRDNGPQDTRHLLGFNAYLDGIGTKYIGPGPAAAIQWNPAYSDIAIGAAPAGSPGQSASIPATLTVGDDGRVGIGTRDRQALLHLRQANGAATLRVESGNLLSAPGMEFWAGSLSQMTVRLGAVRAEYDQANVLGVLKFQVNDGQTPTGLRQVLTMDTANSRLDSRLGIGTAPDPADRLSVDGAARFTQPGTPGNHVRIRHDGTDAVIEHQTATASSNAANRLVINPGGNRTEFGGTVVMDANLGLGTDDFLDTGNGKDYRLSVDGRIRAHEVKVYSGWADHVFKRGYDLMPLAEVADFIADHGHLPGVPSAAEVAANGVDVGETQALLLEKIEELTLYLIKLGEENERMKIEIEELKK